MAIEWPGKRAEVKRAMDIFRVDANGRIVKHWDVMQVLPDTSANANGMF